MPDSLAALHSKEGVEARDGRVRPVLAGRTADDLSGRVSPTGTIPGVFLNPQEGREPLGTRLQRPIDLLRRIICQQH
jgi:hypothetical protein